MGIGALASTQLEATSILQQASSGLGMISGKAATNLIGRSAEARNQIINNANSMADTAIDSATRAQLAGDIDRATYEERVRQANLWRDQTITDAETTHKKVVSEAWNMAYGLAAVNDWISKHIPKWMQSFATASIPIPITPLPTPTAQMGGIVTKPTSLIAGEEGPEAIIPLSHGLLHGTSEIHIHIGNFMGDETSMRSLTRKIQEIMREEDRRTLFGGSINSGYGYGRSSM